jgi:hypothetical protein
MNHDQHGRHADTGRQKAGAAATTANRARVKPKGCISALPGRVAGGGKPDNVGSQTRFSLLITHYEFNCILQQKPMMVISAQLIETGGETFYWVMARKPPAGGE